MKTKKQFTILEETVVTNDYFSTTVFESDLMAKYCHKSKMLYITKFNAEDCSMPDVAECKIDLKTPFAFELNFLYFVANNKFGQHEEVENFFRNLWCKQ